MTGPVPDARDDREVREVRESSRGERRAGGVTRRSWREELRIGLAAFVVGAVHRCLSVTYSARRPQASFAARRRAGEAVRCIYATWHESLWHGMQAMRGEDMIVMVSAHRDGEIIARVGRRRGYEFVRGSSTRGGARAMLEFTRLAREKSGDLAMILDGPKGPRREIKEGALFAASRTGLPIVPCGLHVDRAWRAKSWDRHVIGKPFARVAVALGPELRVPPDASREELAGEWRERLLRAMDEAEEQARRSLQAGA
jgi:lysophospholipid acyltransferase (LPLAT)-like uncharacterized protein